MSSWVSFWLVKTDKGQEIPARTALGATCTLAVVTIGRYRDTCQNSTRSYMFSSSSYNRQIQRDTCQNSTRSYMHSSSSYNRQIQRYLLEQHQKLNALQQYREIPARTALGATCTLAVVTIGRYRYPLVQYLHSSSIYNRLIQRYLLVQSIYSSSSYNRLIQRYLLVQSIYSSSSYKRQIQRYLLVQSIYSSSSYKRQIQRYLLHGLQQQLTQVYIVIPARIVRALQQYLQQVDIEIPASIVHLELHVIQLQLLKVNIEITASLVLRAICTRAIVILGRSKDTCQFSTQSFIHVFQQQLQQVYIDT